MIPNNPLHYWLMTTEYPPFSGGGISTYAHNTARMMVEGGMEVTVFVHDEKLETDMRIETPEKNIRVVRFCIDEMTIANEGLCRFLGPSAKQSYCFADIIHQFIVKEGMPACVEAQDYMAIAYYLIARKRSLDPVLRDLKIVIALHCPRFLVEDMDRGPTFLLPSYWVGEMERFCISACDVLLAPSRAMKKRLLAMGLTTAKKAKIVPNPYAQQHFGKHRDIIPNSLLFIGRLQHGKGIFDLLAAMKDRWQRGEKLALYVIGGDWDCLIEHNTIRQQIEDKYHDYITGGLLILLGKLTYAETLARLQKHIFVILPSHFESFSYSLVEAINAGACCILPNSSGHAEVAGTKKEAAILYQPHNKQSLDEAITHALALTQEQRDNLSKNGQARVKALTKYKTIFDKKWSYIRSAPSHETIYPFIRQSSQSPLVNPLPNAQKGLLSIVIPYYNMGEYVEETLQSLHMSSYKNYEWIVVDDGSTEPASLAKLEDLSHKYPLRIVKKENNGLAEARNTGAAAAHGEFLAFIDPDDKAHPAFFERAIAILQNYKNVAFVGATTEYFGNSHDYWPCWNPEPPYLLFHNTINSSALLFRRDVFLNYGKNDPTMIYGMEDYEVVIRLVGQGFGGVAIPDPMFHYRIRTGSMSRSFNRNKMIYLYKLIADKHHAFFAKYASDIANLLNANGPGYPIANPSFGHPDNISLF